MGPNRPQAPVAIIFVAIFLNSGFEARSEEPIGAEHLQNAGHASPDERWISSTPAPREPQGRVVRDNEILPGIYLIDGLDESLPTYDLRALGNLIGGAEVVGLGESIHTSGGYYRAKYRVFRYLVEELGFRAFAFESPWYDAERVREFVETCEGSPNSDIVNGLFGVWAARSVRDLVEWMCGFNQTHPDDPVAFWGFDIQQPWDDGRLLFEFLDRVVVRPPAFQQGIERCNGVGYESVYDYYTDPDSQVVTEDDHVACLEALETLETFFDENEDDLAVRTSADALAWARINAVGIRSWENIRYFDARENWAMGSQSRDQGMAWVFQAIKSLRNPNDRVAIWAHNWHIAFDTQHMPVSDGARSMGTFLRDDLGDAYFVLGLVGYEVSINWPGVGIGPLPPPPSPMHVEYRLHHEIERDYLLVDLNFGGTDEPFIEENNWYFLNGWWLVPASHFDALLYLDVSPKMILLWP